MLTRDEENYFPELQGDQSSLEHTTPVMQAIDTAAIDAQQALPGLQGRRQLWFAGAWAGYGFHEDGLKSGLAAAQGVLDRLARAAPTLGTVPTSELAA